MNKKQLSLIRRYFGKTQKQMAQLLGLSIKAIQSFEQGWRSVPVHIERQLLLLLSLKKSRAKSNRPCWLVKNCSMETRKACPAWEFNAGHLCWCINGTICQGSPQRSWAKKIQICRKCEVFRSMLPLDGVRIA
jgi:DNA-binding XRE family transcriptional regulator